MRCASFPAGAAVTAGALLACSPLQAHHSYAMFDMKKDVALEGTVSEFQWTNPHIWIDLVAIDKGTGQSTKWSIEGSAPTSLRAMGWRQDSLKQGDQVSLVVHPLKDGSHGGTLVKILVNGRELNTKG